MKNSTITLSQAYIDRVKQNITPHWDELGWVTYKRTYARWLPEKIVLKIGMKPLKELWKVISILTPA